MDSCDTLEQVLAVPGIGAQIVGGIALLERVQLRRACPAFRSTVDESLEGIHELFWEDIADVASRPGGLDWLLPKCPNLRTLSIWSRTAHQVPWDRREHAIQGRLAACPGTARQSLLGLGHCRRLRSLTLASCPDVDDNVLMVVASSCWDLETLDVRNCQVTDKGVTVVAMYCARLKELRVGESQQVTDASFQKIAERCRLLEQLVIEGTSVTDVGVSAIARHCPNLRHLEMDPGPWTGITDASVIAVATHCPRLEYLNVENFEEEISDTSLTAIARRCPDLRGLGVGTSAVTDAGLMAVASGCRQLQALNIAGQGITSEALTYLARHCPHLRRLDAPFVASIDDTVLLALGAHCRELHHLSIQGAGVTDFGIEALAKGCPRLDHLAVACPHVTDAGMAAVARGCPHLRHLYLRSCECVTDTGMGAIARCCPQLLRLELFRCPKVTEACLCAVGEGCRRLEQLRFSALEGGVTDASMRVVARNCTRLHSIAMHRGGFGEAALRALVENCERLEHLEISGADFALENSMAAISRHCTCLRSLSVTSCPMLSDKDLVTALSGRAGARLLDLDLSCNDGIADNALLAVATACPLLHTLDVSECGGVTDAGIRAVARSCQRLVAQCVYHTQVTEESLRLFDQGDA
eukprot:jgi/Mesvir1/27631/Mv07362-RA.1